MREGAFLALTGSLMEGVLLRRQSPRLSYDDETTKLNGNSLPRGVVAVCCAIGLYFACAPICQIISENDI
ncbi:hypothetical protein HMPREF9451_01761 [Slackia piriformis YIT 12062]|uniref:Uncharacterized protein n=1 Tax=Slackia piriformis YIT 12062 TaxID=742818 RepID=K0YJ39_9ACTN|nr:hypothetical protein HMPREF9451_01761 [Slackia piriformis YIT 12062]